MIDHLIQAVQLGQPQSRVIGRSIDHAEYLMGRFLQTIFDKCQREFSGVDIRTNRFRRTVVIDGCVVKFVSKSEIDHDRRGTRGWGEFWDHYTDEIE